MVKGHLLTVAQSDQWLAVMGYLFTIMQTRQWLVVMYYLFTIMQFGQYLQYMIYFFTYCTVWSTFCSYSSCILLCSLINNGLWLLLIIAQSGQWLAVMGYLLTVVQSGQWLVVMIT